MKKNDESLSTDKRVAEDKDDDAPLSDSKENITTDKPSLDKGKGIAEEAEDEPVLSDSMEKTSPSLNKDKGFADEDDAALRWEVERELAMAGLYEEPRSPTSNGYLEAVVINNKRKKEDEDEEQLKIPSDCDFQDPPRSFGGVDDIVNAAKHPKC